MFYSRIINRTSNWRTKRSYKPTRKSLALTLLLLLFSILPFQAPGEIKPALAAGSPYPASPVIQNVSFDRSSHSKLAPGSDNWPTTWAADGHLYTAWGDGGGFSGTNSNGRVSLGVGRVEGSASSYKGYNINGGVKPESGRSDWPSGGTEGKSYGMLSLNGDLYMWVTGGKTNNIFNFATLYRSTDKGRKWTAANWQVTHASEGLSVPTILNFGRDYAGARDNYVYHYFIETQDRSTDLNVQRPGRVHLLRVDASASAMMSSKSNYEYFSGTPQNPAWSSKRSDSRPVFEDPNGVGWNLAVSYNAGLQRYILTTEHTKSHSGYFGMFDAPEPWGPWTTVLYDTNGDWEGFNDSTGQGDGTFYWNFPTKWISADGKSFTMVFTGGNPGPLDSWNSIRGKFTVADQSAPEPTPSAIVSNLTVASGKPYQVVDDGLVTGAPFFIDRTFTLKSSPATVEGATYIKTANDDKGRTDSSFLSFQVNQDTTVYVAYDHRASSLPDWLRAWDNTGDSIATTDTDFDLFAKGFAESSTVTLGGNMAAGAAGARSNYFVVVADQGSPVPLPINEPPTVEAGQDQSVTLNSPVTVSLEGAASDDGLPNPPAAMTTAWSKVSGPGSVAFEDPAAVATSATFSEAGVYVLQLSAGDGSLSSADDVTVTVNAAPSSSASITIPGRVEAEEYKDGGEGVGYHDNDAGNAGGEYRSDDVDIQSTSDNGGGYKVMRTAGGEWLAYDVEVSQSGTYNVAARVASGSDRTKSFHVEVDGQDVTGAMSFNDSQGYDTFVDVTVKSVSLSAGRHELRFVMHTGYFSFNYLDVVLSANTAPSVSIVSPGQDDAFLAGEMIDFSATASDLEDGQLSQSSLVWQSSIDGQLGTGEAFQGPLSAGDHLITLVATDSAGATGTSTVGITVTGIIYGDADEDGQFTRQDIHLVVDWVLGKQSMPQAGTPVFAAADVNGDGEISTGDVGLMIDRLSGKITQFPVEA